MSLSANTYRFIAVLVLGLAASLSMPAWAQTCPAGKSEITILTPSGKMKVLCVSETAIEGIENAADHSDGTVVAAACPCFTQADLDAANPISCIDSSTAIRRFISCNNGDFSVEGSFVPENYRQCTGTTPGGPTLVQNISIDELNACSSLLQ